MAAKTMSRRSGGKAAGRKQQSYMSAVREAYNYGFRDGYAAYSHLPNVRGSQTAAQYGYGRGLSAHKKVNKYQTKANAGNNRSSWR